jgi:hypothetical protein
LSDIRTYLKDRILIQDRGGAEFKTGGILLYVEDFKRGSNKDIGPKDIFETGSKSKRGVYSNAGRLSTKKLRVSSETACSAQ